jgi:hypothetical protein
VQSPAESWSHLAQHVPAGKNLIIPIPILAQQTAGGLFALAKWWLENDLPYSPAEMAEMLRQICAMGIQGIIMGDLASQE